MPGLTGTIVIAMGVIIIVSVTVVSLVFLFLPSTASTDTYGQPLDQQGNFTAFGERWFCYKTGVTMDCSMVGKS